MPTPSQKQTSLLRDGAWRLSALGRYGLNILCIFAGYLFTRAHILMTIPYLNLSAYLTGHERLPFQRRVLPMILVNLLLRIPIPHALTHGARGVLAHPETAYLFVIDLVSVAVTAYLTVRLYYKASPNPRFGLLVFPVFLFAALWSYNVHTEQNLYYPYDMMALAFFTAGLYCVYTRRFLALLAVIVVGTLNRETTMFLIPIFVFDAVVPFSLSRWRQIPWLKTFLLAAAWCTVKIILGRLYVHNDAHEDYLRIRENFSIFVPNNWPELFAGCGYLLPVIWLCRKRIQNQRIAQWVWILPMWIAVMICFGVLRETRIYGELCSLVAVASCLLLDAYTASAEPRQTSRNESAALSSS